MTVMDPAAEEASAGLRAAGGVPMLGATALGMVLAERPKPEILADLAGGDRELLLAAHDRVLDLTIGDAAARRQAAALLGEAAEHVSLS